MTNMQIIHSISKCNNYKVLNYSPKLKLLANKLDKEQLLQVTDGINFGSYTDIKLKIGKEYYIMEICPLQDIKEIDLMIKTVREYEDKYGHEFEN